VSLRNTFACTCLALAAAAIAVAAAQQTPPQTPTRPTAPSPAASGFAPGGTPTPRRTAASQAATRGVALCSGLWDGGRTIDQINADNGGVGGTESMKTAIDDARRIVSVTYSDLMPPRIVAWRRVLGCVQLPIGATEDALRFVPQVSPDVVRPDLDARDWPIGDRSAIARLPDAKQKSLDALVESAFDGSTYGGRTWGVIVVKDGKIVAERYAMGFDMHQSAQTHSAAKSFAASLAGIATMKYGLDIDRPGALTEWRRPGDPRGRITARHLLNMASGLYGEGGGSPQADIYAGGAAVAERAATNMLDTLPGTRFLYNPPDTMLLVHAVREAVKNDQAFLAMPFRDLFWKIGMTRTTPASDWNGDFLMSGQTYSSARDFARFGLLYLNDGVWNGERILPEGWAKFVSTLAPVQPADNGPRYGAQFWIYTGMEGLSAAAYTPSGAQGQYAVIIPAQKVVVVRRGFDAGNAFRIAKFCADVLAVVEKTGNSRSDPRIN
jgi:CubicO group peptidase (beta-lactamase class C family)